MKWSWFEQYPESVEEIVLVLSARGGGWLCADSNPTDLLDRVRWPRRLECLVVFLFAEECLI